MNQLIHIENLSYLIGEGEIKEGDWYIDTDLNCPIQRSDRNPVYDHEYAEDKKIIASNNPDLDVLFLELPDGKIDVENAIKDRVHLHKSLYNYSLNELIAFEEGLREAFIGDDNLPAILELLKNKKYSEEQLRKAIDMATEMSDTSIGTYPTYTAHEIIASLHPLPTSCVVDDEEEQMPYGDEEATGWIRLPKTYVSEGRTCIKIKSFDYENT